MNPRQTVDQLLTRFTTRLGSVALKLDDQGVCGFVYGGRFEIVLEVPDGIPADVYLSGKVMTLDGLDPSTLAPVFEHLLRLNAFSPMTRGAYLALEGEGPAVLLCHHCPIAALDEVSFYNVLTQFTHTVESVYGHLSSFTAGAPPSAPVASGGSSGLVQVRG